MLIFFFFLSYSILHDEIKPAEIFKLKGLPLQETKYGFKLPGGIKMSAANRTINFCQQFEEQGKYIRNRLTQLGVQLDIELTLFSDKSRAGFSLNGKQAGSFRSKEYSLLYEKRYFRLEINDLSQLQIADQFVNAVQSNRLPWAYEKNSPQNRAAHEDFFNSWGHFVISSAYGGGSLELKVKSSGSEMSVEAEKKALLQVQAQFKGVTAGLDFDHSDAVGTSKSSSFLTNQLIWDGGDIQCHRQTMEQVTPDIMQQWERSLGSQPSILTTELTLLPIYEVIDLVNRDKFQGCRDAMHDFLGGTFRIKKLEEKEKEEREEKARREQERILEETNNKAIAESVPTNNDSNCFPGDTTVELESGRRIPMSQVRLGDRLAALDCRSGRRIYSEVLLFLDRDPDCQPQFVSLLTERGMRLSLTTTHLIHVAAAAAVEERSSSSSTYPGFCPAYAGSIVVGQRVLVAGPKGAASSIDDFHAEVVVAVSRDSRRGAYAPLTVAGTLIVDNVVASCYAVVDSAWLAHAAFAPLRWWRRVQPSLSPLSSSTKRTREAAPPVGVHWYAGLLYSMAPWLVPGRMALP